MKNTFAPFFFELFSREGNMVKIPIKQKGFIIFDGKNDAIFLKRIYDEIFTPSSTDQDLFQVKLKDFFKEDIPAIEWLKRRKTELGNNLKFTLWTAWKTIIETDPRKRT